MKTYAKKTTGNRIRSAANAVLRKPSAKSTVLFDKRPEAIAQIRLGGMVNESHRAAQLKAQGMPDNFSLQQLPVQQKRTRLPADLESKSENASAHSTDDVRVTQTANKTARFQAYPNTRGTDKYLTHEASHVVQQRQRRIQPTVQATGMDGMSIQRKVGFEYEVGAINPKQNANWTPFFAPTWRQLSKGYVIKEKQGYQITADIAANGGNNLEFVTRPFDETKDGESAAVTSVASSIVADIQQLTNHDPATDIKSSTLSRIRGPRSVYFDVQDKNPVGQLQMTGGVDVRDLADIMSGASLGDMPEQVAEQEGYKAMPLQKYYQTGVEGLAMPIVFTPALNAVNNNFQLEQAPKRMIAAVVALMAQMIITHRDEQEDTNLDRAGRFIAKTDFAEILQQVDDRINVNVNWEGLLPSILTVANGFVENAVDGNSTVFPGTYKVQEQKFTDLSIQDWVTEALPRGRKNETQLELIDIGLAMPYFMEVPTGRRIPKGRDMMTKANYPGTRAQKGELGAYGTYGSKKDPGGKVILEWRDLRSLFAASQLPKFMSALFGYYKGIR